MIRLRAQEKIDEAGAGDFHFADLCTLRQRRDQCLGDRARILARGLRQQHRGIGGEIAVFLLPRALDDKRRGRVGGQRALFPQALDRAQDKLVESFFHEEILKGLRIVVSAVFNQKLSIGSRLRSDAFGADFGGGKPRQKADFSTRCSLWITLWVDMLARTISLC